MSEEKKPETAVEQESEQEKEKKKNRQWHPLFVKSMKIALQDAEPGQLEITSEFTLTSSPLYIDVLVIMYYGQSELSNPIGKIFRRYNIIEYKSPVDYLSVNDYDKGMVLTRYHQVMKNKKVDTINDYTISYVSSGFPREMMKRILGRGFKVERNNPIAGIYRVHGDVYPVQVIVLNHLKDPSVMWPFTPYIRDTVRQNKGLITKLYHEAEKNKEDRDIFDLVEFILSNNIYTTKEWKELWQMLLPRKFTEEEEKEIFKVMDESPAAQIWLRLHIKEIEKKMEEAENAEKKAKETLKKTSIRLLSKKFGELPTVMNNKLNKTSAEKLEQIINDIFDYNSLDDINKYLDN